MHKSIFIECLHDAFWDVKKTKYFFVLDAYTIFSFDNTILLWKKRTKLSVTQLAWNCSDVPENKPSKTRRKKRVRYLIQFNRRELSFLLFCNICSICAVEKVLTRSNRRKIIAFCCKLVCEKCGDSFVRDKRNGFSCGINLKVRTRAESCESVRIGKSVLSGVENSCESAEAIIISL